MSTLSRVQMIIGTRLKLQPEDCRPECDIVADLGADSLDIVYIIFDVEREFAIDIPDTHLQSMVTVNDVAIEISRLQDTQLVVA